MEIGGSGGLSSGSSLSGQSVSSPRKISDSLGLAKAMNDGAIVSGLLPAYSARPGSGPGAGAAGLDPDIYTAVGMQAQGMMSRGLVGIQIANIALGIDMSEAAQDSKPSETGASDDTEAEGPVEAEDAAGADAPRYYMSPGLSNPGLGGLLNSMG